MIDYVVYPQLNAVCMSISEVKNYTLNIENRTIAITGIDGSGLFLDCVVCVCFSETLFYVYYENNKTFLATDTEDLSDFFTGFF